MANSFYRGQTVKYKGEGYTIISLDVVYAVLQHKITKQRIEVHLLALET